MNSRLVLLIGVILAVSAFAFALPTSVLTTTPSEPNAFGWFNPMVTVSINAADTDSAIEVIKYTFDLNKKRTPSPDLNWTGDMNFFHGVRTFRYQAISMDGNIEPEKRYTVQVDSMVPEALGFSLDATQGTTYNPATKTFDINYGIARLRIISGDNTSGLATCELNFDYNALDPAVGWDAPTTDVTLVTPHVHYYDTNGIKVIAIKCTDKANNTSAPSTSPYIFNVINAHDSTPPVSTLIIDTNSTSSGKWYNDNVIATITASDPESGISAVKYCIDKSDTCTPNIAYSAPILFSAEGMKYLRYNSTNGQAMDENVNSKMISIDKTAPVMVDAMYYLGGFTNFATRTIDFNYGQIMASINAPTDALSGVTTCQFNFDYNAANPAAGWNTPIAAQGVTLPYFATGVFTTLGTKVVAVKCVDDANNYSRVITSTPPFTIRTNGFYTINSMTITPNPIMLDRNVVVELNVTDNNGTKSIEIEFTKGSFSKKLTAVEVSDGIFRVVATPDINWPAGPMSVVAKITDIANGVRYKQIDTNTIDVYTLNMTLNPSTVTVGSDVTVSGYVTSNTGRANPTGTITITSGLGTVSTATDSNGVLSLTFNAGTVGTFTLTADFTGGGTTATNTAILTVNAATPSGPTGGGGGGSYIPPTDTNRPADTNVPVVVPVDTNTNTPDLNAPLNDVNVNNVIPPFDLNALTPGESDTNMLASDSNALTAAAPTTGLFGFLGNTSGATPASWALPLLIILLALMLVMLWVRTQNGKPEQVVAGKKWIRK